MSRYYRPRAKIKLDIASWNADAGQSDPEFLELWPKVIELKWTKNDHLTADELTFSINWMEGGFDPRLHKHGHVQMWLWDEEVKFDADEVADLRFSGIVTKATRKISEHGVVVEITARDHTQMFLDMKPFHDEGIPEWSDTLRTAWQKICDNTGYYDPEKKAIVSSVKELRNNIEFIPPELEATTLLGAVTDRFHAISKPTPKQGSDAWGVWQWITAMSSHVTYIDRGKCIVTTTSEHFREEDAPLFIYGDNIEEFEEEADTAISNNGVLVKSYNPLTNKLLEAVYPPPGDPRIKKTRAQARRIGKGNNELNETSHDYDEFGAPWIQEQDALEAFARHAYELRSKQEMKGRLKTREMVVFAGQQGNIEVDIFDLAAGDCIHFGLHQDCFDAIQHIEGEVHQVAYLVDTLGIDPFAAQVMVRNMPREKALMSPVFHLETMEVVLTPEEFYVEIRFHNKIWLVREEDAA